VVEAAAGAACVELVAAAVSAVLVDPPESLEPHALRTATAKMARTAMTAADRLTAADYVLCSLP